MVHIIVKGHVLYKDMPFLLSVYYNFIIVLLSYYCTLSYNYYLCYKNNKL
nr:MAG TPA: hypothetical protein [Caudoviricetes sp.]